MAFEGGVEVERVYLHHASLKNACQLRTCSSRTGKMGQLSQVFSEIQILAKLFS